MRDGGGLGDLHRELTEEQSRLMLRRLWVSRGNCNDSNVVARPKRSREWLKVRSCGIGYQEM